MDDAPDPAPDAPRFGPFTLLEQLGEGGDGTVHRAWDPRHGRYVALKLLKDGRRRLREAQMLARLSHPSIIKVFEAGEIDRRLFIVMELVPGLRFDAWLESGPDLDDLLRVFSETCEALEHAHAAGIVHRDLKPSNVLIDDLRRPRVVDFGLARPQEGWTVTRRGEIVGTPAFMSPEQVRGVDGTAEAVDVYGLGALLYFGLARRPPFTGASTQETLEAVLNGHPAPPPGPPPLGKICLQALEKDPRHRYPNVRALREDVERFRRGDSVRARRRFRGWRPIGAAAALLAVTLFAFRPTPDVQPELDAGRGGLEQAERLFYVADAPLLALRERLDKAVAHLSAALARDPRNADASYLRGKALVMRGDDALPDLDRAVTLAPTNPSFLLARAQARAARIDVEPGLRDGARRDFEIVASLTRDEGDRRLALAQAARLSGRVAEAFAHAEAALAREPDRWELHDLRALCAPSLAEREMSARAAVRLRPNDASLRRRASNAIEPRSPADALPFLQDSLRLRDDPSTREALVRVLRKLGRDREALDEADRLVAASPGMGRYPRSQARLALGDVRGAIADLEACLRVRDSWDYRGDLASALIAADRAAEAVDALRRAFALNSTGDRQLDATLARLVRAYPPALALARDVEASRPALAEVVVLDAALRAAVDSRRIALGDYEGASGAPGTDRESALLRSVASLCRGASTSPVFPDALFEGGDRVAYAARIARGATTRDRADLARAAALFPERLEHRLLEAALDAAPASALLGMILDASSR